MEFNHPHTRLCSCGNTMGSFRGNQDQFDRARLQEESGTRYDY